MLFRSVGTLEAKEIYSTCVVELEKDVSYECYSFDYNKVSMLNAFTVIRGQYNGCSESDETIRLTTSDGKYELTLCAGCHIVLSVSEITE